jgi:hypothetical protein
MPKVVGEGPTKKLESVDLKKDFVGKDRSEVDGFVIPWGYYYYQSGSKAEKKLMTDSMGSCFAVVCHHLKTNKIFFAHVSNDDETTSVVDAIKRVQPEKDGYTCVIVMGTDPKPATTMKRINKILAAADYGFHVFQAANGGVAYHLDGTIVMGQKAKQKCTVSEKDVKVAMGLAAKGPLRQMSASLDLTKD